MRENLKRLRIKKRYTQVEISKAIGVTTRHYKGLEAGTSNGSVKVWEKLRDVLGAKSIDILRQQDNQ